MQTRLFVGSLAFAAAAATSGCAVRSGPFGSGQFLATEADKRIITTFQPAERLQFGRVSPAQITCAEPSPDVAKVVAEALELAAKAEGQGTDPRTGIQAQGAAALAASHSRAESLAQLTVRLATIQLLRDGLFRACEAYGNGALSDTSYEVILSRYGHTMVTLLMGELAANNSSPLLVVGSSASGSAAVQKALDNIDALAKTVGEKKVILDKKQTEVDSAADADKEAKRKERDDALKEYATAVTALTSALDSGPGNALQLAVSSTATAGQVSPAPSSGSGSGGGRPDADTNDDGRNRSIQFIDRTYMENINFDPIIVACLSALDRPRDDPRGSTELAAECLKWLPDIITGGNNTLQKKVQNRFELDKIRALKPHPPAAPAGH